MKLLQEGAVIKLTDGSDAIFENIRYLDDLGEKTGTITIVKNGDELGFRIVAEAGGTGIKAIEDFLGDRLAYAKINRLTLEQIPQNTEGLIPAHDMEFFLKTFAPK